MSKYAFNPTGEDKIQGKAGKAELRGFIAHYKQSPAAKATDAVHAAVTDDGTEQEITTNITNPDVPRSITATAGGTAGDIKAIQVTIEGTNVAGETITETLPAFTVDTAGTVEGSKAFKTVTKITIPAHDGNGATTEIGTGSALGLSHELDDNTVIPGMTALNGSREGTEPTVATDGSAVEGNTADLNSALDGNEVDIWYIAEGGQ